MSRIAYDPVKDRFARLIQRSRLLRRGFYFLLDLFFLRGWHLRRLIRDYGRNFEQKGDWRLLDAGCGFGQYDRFVLDRFHRVKVMSVDLKRDYLKDCEHYFERDVKTGRIFFLQENLLEMAAENIYDMAICIDVLEHIEEDVTAIKNCAESLKPGGVFIMHSPSHLSEEDAEGDGSFVGEHARAGYSKSDISEKLKQAGLKPENVFYTYGKYGHFAWVLSIKYPMLLLSNTGLKGLLLLLLYYPLIMPLCLVLNWLDMLTPNKTGNGICAVGLKPV